jgi:hypothetical protein
MGASSGTTIAFMELGISRNTASSLTEIVGARDMTFDECKDYLMQTSLAALDLPKASIEEIEKYRESSLYRKE